MGKLPFNKLLICEEDVIFFWWVEIVVTSNKWINQPPLFFYCNTGCSEFQDIVFSFDKSASIADQTLEDAYIAALSVIASLDQDQDNNGPKEKVRVGIQTFNQDQQVIQHLNEFGPLPPPPPTTGTTDIIGALK